MAHELVELLVFVELTRRAVPDFLLRAQHSVTRSDRLTKQATCLSLRWANSSLSPQASVGGGGLITDGLTESLRSGSVNSSTM